MPRRLEGCTATHPALLFMLHADGRPGAWGNLGLWRTGPSDDDYFGACSALARARSASS